MPDGFKNQIPIGVRCLCGSIVKITLEIPLTDSGYYVSQCKCGENVQFVYNIFPMIGDIIA